MNYVREEGNIAKLHSLPIGESMGKDGGDQRGKSSPTLNVELNS